MSKKELKENPVFKPKLKEFSNHFSIFPRFYFRGKLCLANDGWRHSAKNKVALNIGANFLPDTRHVRVLGVAL